MIRIKPSKRNTNKHTEKGMQLLGSSIEEVGVIEGISVTKQGTIISGHARKEKFDEKGLVPKEITLAENEYPVIVRNDIEDDTDTYYKAQILANTTAHQNYNLDLEEVEAVAEEYGIELEELGIEIEEKSIDYSDDSFNEDELIEDPRNKPAIIKITFENAEQLQKAETDIIELIDRKYKGAYYSVSCGEL
jgi:hypothetical protein|nr:MAG TPA: hypothetical protein [Caudoviricetes sp.]